MPQPGRPLSGSQSLASFRKHPYGPAVHVVRGLRQAFVTLLLAALLALAAAGVWFALQGGGFRPKVGVVLMIAAGLISVTGGTEISRHMTSDARAFLGAGPDREQPDSGKSLTAAGVFLFVSLPLFLVDGLLYGSG